MNRFPFFGKTDSAAACKEISSFNFFKVRDAECMKVEEIWTIWNISLS